MFRWLTTRSRQSPRRPGLAEHLRSGSHARLFICEAHKFIYCKTAKAAGTSILRRHLDQVMPELLISDQHAAAQDWLRRITDDQLDEYFIFTVVRNPWDRMVSAAQFFKIPFQDFIHNLREHRKNHRICDHTLPNHLSTHYSGGQFADAVCRFECLQPDYNLVCDRLGIKRTSLPYANRTEHEHYSHYYGDAERLIVEREFQQDIRLFGYCFERESKTFNPQRVTQLRAPLLSSALSAVAGI